MIERFEQLDAWQRARELAKVVYACTTLGPFARDFGHRDQINRAAASVAGNIAEGFDRGSRAEFQQFLSVAKGSCAEVRSHLYIAHDRGYLSSEDLERLLAQATDVSRLVARLRSAVARQRDEQRGRRPGQNGSP